MQATFLAIGGLGNTELLIILGLVFLLFGTKKLPSVAKDLGEGIRAFRAEMSASKQPPAQLPAEPREQLTTPRDVTEEQRAPR